MLFLPPHCRQESACEDAAFVPSPKGFRGGLRLNSAPRPANLHQATSVGPRQRALKKGVLQGTQMAKPDFLDLLRPSENTLFLP